KAASSTGQEVAAGRSGLMVQLLRQGHRKLLPSAHDSGNRGIGSGAKSIDVERFVGVEHRMAEIDHRGHPARGDPLWASRRQGWLPAPGVEVGLSANKGYSQRHLLRAGTAAPGCPVCPG